MLSAILLTGTEICVNKVLNAVSLSANRNDVTLRGKYRVRNPPMSTQIHPHLTAFNIHGWIFQSISGYVESAVKTRSLYALGF
jgi:hypothetical protein